MSDPEFSVQFKMTVKGKDAFRSMRWRLWLFALTSLLAGVLWQAWG